MGTGERISLRHTRAILDAIHSGDLADTPTLTESVFGLNVVTRCPEVPAELLIPRNAWQDAAAYDEAAADLANRFQSNFESYADGVSNEVLAAGPQSTNDIKN